MNEKDLNRILVSSAATLGGWAYKIVDPSTAAIRIGAGYRPFDIFGYMQKYDLIFESKFLRGYSSFNFRMIKPHQLENLKKIKEIKKSRRHQSKNVERSSIEAIVLGIYYPRKFFDVFFFDVDFILGLIENGKNSILKKELEKYRDSGLLLKVNQNFIDLNKIGEVLINGRPR